MNKVILKGTGGSGVTFFKRRYQEQIANDNHHHKVMIDDSTPLVYLYANPYVILKSFERRGFLYPAVFELQGKTDFLKSFNIPLSNTLGFYDFSLDEFLEIGVDLFEFENHYDYFANTPNKKMLIKYEGLTKSLKRIEKNFGIQTKHFVNLEKRNSSINDYSKEQFKKVEKIYGDWFEKYNQLPQIKIIK